MQGLIPKNEYGIFANADGVAMVDSRTVAERFERRHDNVLRDIRNLDCSEEFRLLNFEESNYLNEQHKRLPCINMTRDGFVFLVMGFTGETAAKFKEAYIRQFNKMESYIKTFMATRTDFPMLTDNIKLAHDEPKSYHYSNETNMVYKIAIGMTAAQYRKEHGLDKKENIRAHLTKEQLEIVDDLQRVDSGFVLSIPDYQERKRKLEWYRMKKYGCLEEPEE